MTKPLQPRLIRPSKDGEEGGWSYLFEANGEDYIFPALVNELGGLKPLIGYDSKEPAEPTPREPGEEVYSTKVIYWKASEWETKLLPFAVEWTNLYGFAWPDVPYPVMEFRKIEDRRGEDRVAEVLNVAALDRKSDADPRPPALLVRQFTEVGGEEGKGRKPLLQWWMQSSIHFHGPRNVEGNGWSVPEACGRIGEWSAAPDFLKQRIEERGAAEYFKTISVRYEAPLSYEETRAVTVWIAFCRYITSLKTTYEDGLPNRGRRRSEARTTEEALTLEQATLFKTVGVLKSGARSKPVATGTGTKHRYRYLVRGHERIINGRSIWIKPQVRGEGEFLARSVGTDEAIDAAKEIEPPAKVTVEATQAEAEAEAVSEEALEEVKQAEESAPAEVKPDEPIPEPPKPPADLIFCTVEAPSPHKRTRWVEKVLTYLRSLFRP